MLVDSWKLRRGECACPTECSRRWRGPDKEKNVVWVCKSCSSEKGARRPYEWYTRRSGLKAAKYDVPRIAEGKYLELVYEILGEEGLLDVSVEDLRVRICPDCDLGDLCVEEDSVGELPVLCLDGMVGGCLG